MTQAPIIETQRLVLRPHQIADFEPYAEIFASDRARYMNGPLSRRAAWNYFASDVAQWALFGFGSWAITIPSDDRMLGQVLLQKPDYYPEVELGWMILPEGEGKGYVFEAATAARDFAFETCGLETLVSYIDRANSRSITLATRLDAMPDETAPLPDGETHADTVAYRHPRPDNQGAGMEAYA